MRSLKAYLGFLAVLALTGLALVFFYVPSVAPVQETPQQSGVTAGGVFRGLHFWAAQLVVLAALVHLACVILSKRTVRAAGGQRC